MKPAWLFVATTEDRQSATTISRHGSPAFYFLVLVEFFPWPRLAWFGIPPSANHFAASLLNGPPIWFTRSRTLMADCLIGVGSNLGDRAKNIHAAFEKLDEHAQIEVSARSQLHETDPVGGPNDQPAFLNAAARLTTSLSPVALLEVLQRIERETGPTKTIYWGPRLLDLDILLFDEAIISQRKEGQLLRCDLHVPHPRMSFRRFVLEPATEIAGPMLHPVLKMTIAELLAQLNNTPHYLALAGSSQSARSRLAAKVSTQLNCNHIHTSGQHGNFPEGDDAVHCDLEQQLAMLENYCDTLRGLDFSAGPTIGDIWFDSLLVYASLTLDSTELTRYQAAWDSHRAEVATPRVVVIITSTPALPHDMSHLDRVTGQGPVLVLEQDDLEQQCREVASALMACK